MATRQTVRAELLQLDELSKNEQTSTITEIQEFMLKHELLDEDGKKYMISFFGSFALVNIFLVSTVFGLTAIDNSSSSNIETCQADCTPLANNFVTICLDFTLRSILGSLGMPTSHKSSIMDMAKLITQSEHQTNTRTKMR